uniref:Auxin-responsive protein SAUR71-like n=1 Tax=Nelumbo nucifera TaxID=4432 RepID=A0A822Y8E5_NELNU|nr:TPA_asm: hypothetical protein HUJ06_030010 [Nelumbo nucifera]
MAKNRKNGGGGERGILMLSHAMEKLQKGLTLMRSTGIGDSKSNGVEGEKATVPLDVKEGHYAVFAVEGCERERFIVELGYLTNPHFLLLLREAEEEFGFKQEGVVGRNISIGF